MAPKRTLPSPPTSAGGEAVYELIDADLERDRETVISIWRGSIGWQDQLGEMYDVFYLNCPFGRPVLKILYHRASNSPVGVIGLGRRRMLWQGQEIRVCVVSHFAVLPSHRTVKPAVSMIKGIVEAAAEQFDLLYGLPSVKASAACRRAGMKITGQLSRHVKVLRYQVYLQRLLPKPMAVPAGMLLNMIGSLRNRLRNFFGETPLYCEWSDTVDPRMQQLWEGSAHGTCLTAIRETSMLNWRFCKLPAIARRFLLVGPARGEPLLAWFACETSVLAPSIMTITDFWSIEGTQPLARHVIRALCNAAFTQGYHAAELKFFGGPGTLSSWRAEGFVERKGQPVYAIWLNPAIAGDIASNVHMTDIDQDG